jgi:hypothetical protein
MFPLQGSLLDDCEKQDLFSFLDNMVTDCPQLATEPITPTSETQEERKGPGRPKKRKRQESEVEVKRELLTEDEKRQNHVQSEQRRRKLIKEGFETLVQLTPALQHTPVNTGPGNTGGSHSKSTILDQAANYIRELQAQVESLKAQLRLEKEKFKYPYQPSFVNVQPSFLAPEYYQVYGTENSTASTTA